MWGKVLLWNFLCQGLWGVEEWGKLGYRTKTKGEEIQCQKRRGGGRKSQKRAPQGTWVTTMPLPKTNNFSLGLEDMKQCFSGHMCRLEKCKVPYQPAYLLCGEKEKRERRSRFVSPCPPGGFMPNKRLSLSCSSLFLDCMHVLLSSVLPCIAAYHPYL